MGWHVVYDTTADPGHVLPWVGMLYMIQQPIQGMVELHRIMWGKLECVRIHSVKGEVHNKPWPPSVLWNATEW
jgi:hypothetical protein